MRQHLALGLARHRKTQVGEHVPQEIQNGEPRVKDVRKGNLIAVQGLEQAPHEQRLAGSNLSGHHNESLSSLHSIIQIRQSLVVPRRRIEEIRIRADFKWVPRQPVEFSVHCAQPLMNEMTFPATTPKVRSTMAALSASPSHFCRLVSADVLIRGIPTSTRADTTSSRSFSWRTRTSVSSLRSVRPIPRKTPPASPPRLINKRFGENGARGASEGSIKAKCCPCACCCRSVAN